jgi:predicted nucleotidyltransferase
MADMDTAPAPRHDAPEVHAAVEPRFAFADARTLAALPALCRRFGARRLDLFGSAATGRFDPNRSDLDFLVCFDNLLPPGAYTDAWFGLRTALEALFGRRVDLLTEAALENPYLRRRVEVERRPLFKAGAAAG